MMRNRWRLLQVRTVLAVVLAFALVTLPIASAYAMPLGHASGGQPTGSALQTDVTTASSGHHAEAKDTAEKAGCQKSSDTGEPEGKSCCMVGCLTTANMDLFSFTQAVPARSHISSFTEQQLFAGYAFGLKRPPRI